MSSPDNEALKVFAATVLRDRTASAQDSTRIASIALTTYGDLAGVLVPLIGDEGVKALTSRAVYLVQQQFAAGEGTLASDDGTSDSIGSWLAKLDSSLTLDAAGKIFSALAGLLGTFIGESLTMRLLRKAWPEDLPAMDTGDSP